MPIGTSDGQTFDDEWSYATSALNDAMPSSEKMKFLDTSSMFENGVGQDTQTLGMRMRNYSNPGTAYFLKGLESEMESKQILADSFSNEDHLDYTAPHPQLISDHKNYDQASSEMKLSPQEQFLYQMHLHNLDSSGGVDNPDGSRSTLFQAVEPHNGKFYNIPTVWNGKIETKDWTRPSDGKTFKVPNQTALDNVDRIGWDKFPSYDTPEEADRRYMQMHNYMEQDTKSYLENRNK